MQATLAASMLKWRAPSTRVGWLRRILVVTIALLTLIPVMLTLLRELVAQSWNAVEGPFSHVSIFAVMVYGDSVLVLMLVCIGIFELLVARQQLDGRVPEFFTSKWWWLMLVPCVVVGQQLLEYFQEPRLGPVIYQQAWIFDWYHDLVAGLVIHQLLAVIGLGRGIGLRHIGYGARLALVAALLLLAVYGIVWSQHPEKRVIENGVAINLDGYGGAWAVDRLFLRTQDN